jgi:hypothetical protein
MRLQLLELQLDLLLEGLSHRAESLPDAPPARRFLSREIFSFVYNSGILEDTSFREPKSG